MGGTAYLCDRAEASTIPSLLVAAPRSPKDEVEEEAETYKAMYNNGVGDFRVVYEDGTCVAVDPDAAAQYSDGYGSHYLGDLDPQEVYYKSLLKRYDDLRKSLAKIDRKKLLAMAAAGAEKHADVPVWRNEWRRAFDKEYPTKYVLAQIDEKNLFYGIDYAGTSLDHYGSISKQKGCWIWALLAMVGESGTLDYYRVGQIRELGHKAGQLIIRLRSGQSLNLSNEVEEDAEEWYPENGGVNSEDEADGDKGCNDTEVAEAGNVEVASEGVNQSQAEDSGKQVTSVLLGSAKEKMDNANTSDSEDEGEINEEDNGTKTQPSDELEKARARLLAQLGERLVTTSVPEAKTPPAQSEMKQVHGTPRAGRRHRHNGKVCKDPECKGKGRYGKHARTANGGRSNESKSSASTELSGIAENTAIEKPEQVKNTQAEGSVEPSLVDENSPMASESYIEDTVSKDTSSPPPTNASDYEPDDQSIQEDRSKNNGSEPEPNGGADPNTRATLDMILTVVAERYGQKDLLKYRDAW